MEIVLEKLVCETEEDAASFLARHSGLSKSRIKDAMTKGAVWCDASGKSRRLRRAKAIPPKGANLSLYFSQKVLAKEPESPALIDDQISYSVWVKPAGLFSNGTRFGDHCAINRVVEKQMDRPTFLVHRLDQRVWGLMVMAHTKQTAAFLSEQFHHRQVEKTYKAVVTGHLSKETTIAEPVDGRNATTLVTPIKQGEDKTLVQIRILTGRKHQIRKHLSSIGHPIIGDRLHGDPDSGSQLLLASTGLVFQRPDGETARYQLEDALHPVI